MSAGDAPSGTAGIQSQSRRQSSLWAIELSALLVAAGIARRPVEPRSVKALSSSAAIGAVGLQKGLSRFRHLGGRVFY
jgi:hypothetical protein